MWRWSGHQSFHVLIKLGLGRRNFAGFGSVVLSAWCLATEASFSDP
ncbi:hypothetical protein [Rubritalea tangerina]